ncbi:TPA: hypothetical protein ACNIB0_001441 [Citrobacter koseri]
MKRVDRHHFVVFPYRYQVRDDGEINNGGIDLTTSPGRISDIHEVEDYPWLRTFLVMVNAEGGLFMTFGCVAGPVSNSFCGYIDFSLRPGTPEQLKKDLVMLDERFYEYLTQAMPEGEIRTQGMKYAQSILRWNLSPLEIRGESYSKVNLTFDALEENGAAWAIEHVCYFLTKVYPSLTPVKTT